MNALKYWATAIAVDAASWAALVAWKYYGIEGAGNVVVTWLWFCSTLALLFGLLGNKTWFRVRPAGFSTYHGVTEAVLFCTLSFHGLIWLSVYRLAAMIAFEAACVREPKNKKGEA